MTERPNYFEQQQARDERQAAIRRQRERQQQIDRLAKENRSHMEEINRRLEQFRVEAARRAEREAQRNRERGCCRPF